MKQMHFDGVKLIYLCCTDLIASGFGELYEPYETGVTRGFPKPQILELCNKEAARPVWIQYQLPFI